MSELERIGDGLDAVLRRLGIPAPDDARRLVDEWAEVSGEPWATRSRPAGLRGGELTVEADDGAVATVLKFRIGDLVERLNRGLGVELVSTVRIRVAGRRRSPREGR